MSEENCIRVLVVDDDEDDSFLICDTISECKDSNYEVAVSHQPAEAADILRLGETDVVLCDYRMGSVTGIEFIASMRAEGIDVPIILLTGMVGSSTDREALEAGAADFITKSNATPELVDRAIRYAIASNERNRHFQMLLNNVNAAVVLFDKDLAPTLWNPDFSRLAESHAEQANTEIDIPGFFLNTTSMARAAIHEVGADNIGLQFDLYHRQIQEGDVARAIAEYAPLTRHYQIASPPDRGEPDDGEMNYSYLFKKIDETGFDGWIGCEYKSRGATTAGLSWPANCGVTLGG